MSGPGKGRYTTYVPISNDRNKLLWKLFNGKAGAAGNFYGSSNGPQTNNVNAAAAAVATASSYLLPTTGNQAGDLGMFPNGVDLSYGNAPNLNDVAWNRAGDPANSYVPDITSPGPGKTSGLEKDLNPNISATDVKPNYVPGQNTASPDATSDQVGVSPLVRDLIPGKSSV